MNRYGDYRSGPLRLREAAVLYGFGEYGQTSRKRFVQYIVERERTHGVQIIDRTVSSRWRVLPSTIERYCPDLAHVAEKAYRNKNIQEGVVEMVKRVEANLTTTIEKSPPFIELQKRVSELEEIIRVLTGR